MTDAEQATFTQVSLGTTSETTLTGPTGSKFTAGTTTTDPTLTSIDSTSTDGVDESGYAVTDPSDGAWTLEAEVETDALSYGKFTDISPLRIAAAMSSGTYPAGGVATMTVTLAPNDAAVTSSLATFRSPSGAVQTATLRDDGAGGDPVAGDRSWTARLTLPTGTAAVGRWTADGRLGGMLSGSAFDRTGSTLFDVTAGEITATGSYSSTLLDTDSDGMYDVLRLGVGVSIQQPGQYQVAGELSTLDGKLAGQSSTALEAVAAGVQTANLDFSTETMGALGITGKLQLTSLVLANATNALTVVSSGNTGFETPTLDRSTLSVDGRPSVGVTSPNASSPLVRSSFTIQWEASDADSDALVSLFLDSDTEAGGGVAIAGAQNVSENGPVRSFTLDVSAFPEGEYWIEAVITDGTTTRRGHSSGPLRVGTDTDGDGMLDSYENARGTDAGSADALADPDLDGLNNGTEAAIGTLPQDADTDDGGESEGREVLYGRNPLSRSDDLILGSDSHLGDVAPASPDGRVRARDLVTLLRFVSGQSTPTAHQLLRGDVSPAVPSGTGVSKRLGNARITLDDVLLAREVALGRQRMEDRW